MDKIIMKKTSSTATVFIVILILSITGCTSNRAAQKTSASIPPPIYEITAGDWNNIDNNTSGVTRLSISEAEGGWTVHAWGKCHPSDCDWGIVMLNVLGDSIKDKSPRYGHAYWDSGFSGTHLTLRAEGEELAADFYTIFKDGSDRANYRSCYRFKKSL